MGGDNEVSKLFNPSIGSVTPSDVEEYISSAQSRAAAGTAASANGSILGGYDGTRASGASSAGGQQMVVYGPNNNGAGSSGSYSSSYSSTDWNKKAASGYVGLSNQGATCYMNSLIQSLYMTPEFRRALYNWSYDIWAEQSGWPEHQKKKAAGGKDAPQAAADGKAAEANVPEDFEKWKLEFEKKSIPRQLQKLFAHLQLSESRAVQTKNLTKSFGWTDADAFTQHDVQELCRVLFDALEKAWKGTKQENLINELYQGKIKDYVKCSACGHESAREDKFLDVALAIKAFGAPKAVESVEEALRKFVEPEILNGGNQYFCEKCNMKVDAEKGLKFTAFPYLLMLQLKRFDFDYETMRRIKLNDRVTFPQILDLNPFLTGSAAAQPSVSASAAESSSSSSATAVAGDAETAMDVDADAGPEDDKEKEPEPADDDRESKPASKHPEEHLFDASKERVDSLLQNGPAVYELYAILIHRGSANGGHYYAYIKNVTDGKWNEFNDSSVSSVDERSLAESFGESNSGRYSWASSSGTNAYMVVYRQVDSTKNVPVPPNDDIPEVVRNIIAEEERQKQEKEKQKQREREMVKFAVLYKDDKRTIRLHKSEPLSKLVDLAIERFDELKGVAKEDIRLRDWNRYNDVAEKVIDDLTKRPEEQWAGTYNYGGRTVVLESRVAGSAWLPVDTQRLLLSVFVCKDGQYSNTPQPVYVSKAALVGQIKEAFAGEFGIPREKQIVTVDSYRHARMHGVVVGNEHDERTLEEAIGSLYKWGMSVWVESEEPKIENASATPAEEGTSDKSADEIDLSAPELPAHHAPKHIALMKSRVNIRFNHPDQPEDKLDYSVSAYGHELVGDVRERIAKLLSIDPNSFIIQKRMRAYYQARYRYEEINVDQIDLNQLLNIHGDKMDPTRVKAVLKRGSPARNGETSVPLDFLRMYPDWADDVAWEKFKLIESLAKIRVPSVATAAELRALILPVLKEKGVIAADSTITPDQLRLREVSSMGRPSRVNWNPDDKPLKFSFSHRLTVQVLEAPEPKTATNQILFLQRWHPDEYRTGSVEEIAIEDKTPWSEVARIIREKYGVANVGLHKEWMSSTPQSLTQLENFEFGIVDGNITNSRMDDGDWIFWKDMDAPTKELKKEEKDPLVKQDTKKREKLSNDRTSTFHSVRERDLKILQEDV